MREAGLSVLVVIDDEAHMRDFLLDLLAARPGSAKPGHVIQRVSDVREGLHELERSHPDFVIVDAGQPELDDSQVQDRVRDLSLSVPVLVLGTEHNEPCEQNLFVNNYLATPFSRNELALAMQTAHLRWQPRATEVSTVFDDGNLHLDFTYEEVAFDGRRISLRPFEYRLLATLVRHRGQVLGSGHVIELAGDAPIGRDSNGKEMYARARPLGVSDPNPYRRLHRRLVKLDLLYLLDKLLGDGWNDDESPIETVRGFGWRYI